MQIAKIVYATGIQLRFLTQYFRYNAVLYLSAIYWNA